MIIWLLYFALVIYNILDVYPTLLLFDCGWTPIRVMEEDKPEEPKGW